jgi:hypothetical protein
MKEEKGWEGFLSLQRNYSLKVHGFKPEQLPSSASMWDIPRKAGK